MEGRFGRTQLEVAVTLVIALVAGVAIALPGLLSGGGSQQLRTHVPVSTTTTTASADPQPTDDLPATPTSANPVSPASSDAAGSAVAAGQPPAATPRTRSTTTGSAKATTTTRRTTTTAPPPCLNSSESRCGPFRWSPAPGANEPMTITVTANPRDAQVGQPVTFHVEAQDPDASIDEPVSCGFGASFGDPQTAPCHSSPRCPARFGPWTPPDRRAGSVTHDFTHTYTASGFYTAEFELNLNDDCGQNPYRSTGRASVDVTIRP